MVAREVQCDGRMAMEIERAGVQNRLHPLMVSVPESFPAAGHGVEERSLWCCSIRGSAVAIHNGVVPVGVSELEIMGVQGEAQGDKK